MLTLIGQFFGIVLVAKGIVLAVQPRLFQQMWEDKLHLAYPDFANSFVKDFFGMSDRTIRYLGYWFAVLGGLLVWLASRARH